MSVSFTACQVGTGKVLYSGTTDALHVLEKPNVFIIVGEVFNGGWVESGTHFQLPERPSVNHVFNWDTKQWEDSRTLQDLKATQWTKIKQTRNQAEYAGFTWDDSVFDSDALSQQRITGAVTLAQINPDFTINWVLADNTTQSLSQADMMQVGVALGQHVAAQFDKATQLRTLIDSATTKEEIEAIVW